MPRLVFIAKVIAPALLCFAIAIHFATLALFNAPPNSLRFAFLDYIYAYVTPAFYQNWSFFAPEPIDRDVYLIARARRANGSMTAWTNVSRPFINALQRNRLSPKEILVTGISNTMLDALRDASLTQLVQARDIRAIDAMQGPHILYRIAAAILAREYQGQQLVAVQIGMEQSEFPRFTHRFEQTSARKHTFILLPQRAWPQNLDEVPW